MKIKRHQFRNLKIWQRSHQLRKPVYGLTEQFPLTEKFGMVVQLRKAVNSISANIAEGCGRGTNHQLAQFLSFAIGSAYEVESFLEGAMLLEFTSKEEAEPIINELQEIEKMIAVFQTRILNQEKSYKEPDLDYLKIEESNFDITLYSEHSEHSELHSNF